MFTRRRFIGSTLVSGAATTIGAQLALAQGARKRIIVDAQIHLWKAESEDWKWVPGIKPQLNALTRATWRQRVTHFTEALDFLTEDDKDWVMGRSITERLKYRAPQMVISK